MWAGCAPNFRRELRSNNSRPQILSAIGLLSLELQSMGCHMNGFLDLAERQVPAPAKARSMTPKHAAARSGVEREWSERDHQLRAWTQWRLESPGTLPGGPDGPTPP